MLMSTFYVTFIIVQIQAIDCLLQLPWHVDTIGRFILKYTSANLIGLETIIGTFFISVIL